MDLAHDGAVLSLFEYAVVYGAKNELNEQRNQQKDADALVCGVEMLGLPSMSAGCSA